MGCLLRIAALCISIYLIPSSIDVVSNRPQKNAVHSSEDYLPLWRPFLCLILFVYAISRRKPGERFTGWIGDAGGSKKKGRNCFVVIDGWICLHRSYAYHSGCCDALLRAKQAGKEIRKMKVDEAENMGRVPCKLCYGDDDA